MRFYFTDHGAEMAAHYVCGELGDLTYTESLAERVLMMALGTQTIAAPKWVAAVLRRVHMLCCRPPKKHTARKQRPICLRIKQLVTAVARGWRTLSLPSFSPLKCMVRKVRSKASRVKQVVPMAEEQADALNEGIFRSLCRLPRWYQLAADVGNLPGAATVNRVTSWLQTVASAFRGIIPRPGVLGLFNQGLLGFRQVEVLGRPPCVLQAEAFGMHRSAS